MLLVDLALLQAKTEGNFEWLDAIVKLQNEDVKVMSLDQYKREFKQEQFKINLSAKSEWKAQSAHTLTTKEEHSSPFHNMFSPYKAEEPPTAKSVTEGQIEVTLDLAQIALKDGFTILLSVPGGMKIYLSGVNSTGILTSMNEKFKSLKIYVLNEME